MSTYDPKALDMAADIADSLSADEIRSVRSLLDYIADAPEGDVLLGEGVPLVTKSGALIGEFVLEEIDGNEEWVFSPESRDKKREDEPEERPRSTRRR